MFLELHDLSILERRFWNFAKYKITSLMIIIISLLLIHQRKTFIRQLFIQQLRERRSVSILEIVLAMK